MQCEIRLHAKGIWIYYHIIHTRKRFEVFLLRVDSHSLA